MTLSRYLVAAGRFVAVTIMVFAMSAKASAALVYTEDFEDDNIPGAPGFASSIFVHGIAGPNAFITTPFFPTPSPVHALFMGAQTTDNVTFTLAPGDKIESASLWMTGTGGGWAGVSFIGSLGVANFSTITQDSFQLFSVDPSSGIGDVVSIVLGVGPPSPGQEAFYDDISIRVVPEPSTAILAAIGFTGLVLRRRKS